MQPKTEIIILAAGHGKRMESEVPKALTEFAGKTFIDHVLSAVSDSSLNVDPIIIIGKKKEFVKAHLGDGYRYAVQEDQLGTGHAVMMAKDIAKDADTVLVLYADQPLISSKTIKDIVDTKHIENATIAMATAKVENFDDWRSGFTNFSRIVRDESGEIIKVVEAKDASEEELNIKEVNPCYFAFDAKWMFESLSKIDNNNAQGEYYLTDLIKMAFSQNKKISSISIDPKEALGVNTKEQLSNLEKIS